MKAVVNRSYLVTYKNLFRGPCNMYACNSLCFWSLISCSGATFDLVLFTWICFSLLLKFCPLTSIAKNTLRMIFMRLFLCALHSFAYIAILKINYHQFCQRVIYKKSPAVLFGYCILLF